MSHALKFAQTTTPRQKPWCVLGQPLIKSVCFLLLPTVRMVKTIYCLFVQHDLAHAMMASQPAHVRRMAAEQFVENIVSCRGSGCHLDARTILYVSRIHVALRSQRRQ
jgi:hypothetical protein